MCSDQTTAGAVRCTSVCSLATVCCICTQSPIKIPKKRIDVLAHDIIFLFLAIHTLKTYIA